MDIRLFLAARKKTQGKKTRADVQKKKKKKTQGILQKLSIPPTQPRFFHFKTKKRSSRKTQVIRRKTQGI